LGAAPAEPLRGVSASADAGNYQVDEPLGERLTPEVKHHRGGFVLVEFAQFLGYLLCFAFPVGLVLLAVFARRWHDRRLAEHWRELQARRVLAGDEAAVAVVVRV
jgi:uncharacterized membrane protein YhaH (DUF805 family)